MYRTVPAQRMGTAQSARRLGEFNRKHCRIAPRSMIWPSRRTGGNDMTQAGPRSAALPHRGRRHKHSSSLMHPVLSPLPVDPLKNYRALVLDSGYRPIAVVNWQRAICLDIYEKADVLEYFDGVAVHSAHSAHNLPAVVRVRMFVRKHWRYAKVALSRRNILLRDRFVCQYCGAREDLTMDHVKPVSRGGGFSWTNCVTACHSCNSKKGNRTLKKMGWSLRKQPREPTAHEVAAIATTNFAVRSVPKEWSEYLFPGESPSFQGPSFVPSESQIASRSLSV